jgi:hypothetical protein
MAKKYGPNTAPGQVRDRAFRVTIENPNQHVAEPVLPGMIINEEQSVLLEDGVTEQTINKSSDTLAQDYDAEMIIQLRNPLTDEPIPGQMITGEQFFAMVYSAVRQVQENALS